MLADLGASSRFPKRSVNAFLLPAVRDADPDTLVVTDGFSCREQVEQNTGRRPLHVAELLRLGVGG
jgi:hypothetical protein